MLGIAANPTLKYSVYVFVLYGANQSRIKGNPKWEPRARTGAYMEYLDSHTGNVALLLNLQTGHASQQYHVLFDDNFTSVEYVQSGKEPPSWCKLISDSSGKVTDDSYDVILTWYDV